MLIPAELCAVGVARDVRRAWAIDELRWEIVRGVDKAVHKSSFRVRANVWCVSVVR